MNRSLPVRGSAALSFFGVLLLVLAVLPVAYAQTGTTTVRGNVRDQQGNVVAGATVRLINEAQNFTRTQTTSDSGNYSFTGIPPGVYRVEAEATGFSRGAVTDVRALVDTPTDVNIQLAIGDLAETVTVSASTEAILNTTDASIGTTFESQRIMELPLNARNIVGLLSLQPGVTRQGEVSGGRRDQANVTLDGIDVNEQQSGLDVVSGDAFASVLRTTPDSVQEFRVTTSVPNVSQGRSSGAQVALVTRSGTNSFHGALYHFHRNTVTTSNDFFNNALGRNAQGEEIARRPKLIRNIFGGAIGGPIVKDRFFFFYTYEGRRDAAAQSVLRTVPTATLREGLVRYANTAGGITTLTPADIATLFPATGGVNQAGLALLRTAPLPNDFSTGDGLNTAGFRFNAPISTELNTHIAKFDLNVTDRQTMFFRANFQDDLHGRAPQFLTTPSPSLWVHPYGFVLGHSWTATNTLVNNLRVGLTRQAFTQQGDSTANAVTFRFVYQPFLYQRTLSRTTPVWNITDDVSWVKNNHTIQFGTNLRFIRNNRESFANSFDTAIVNPSFYANSGSTLSAPLPGLSPGAAFDARAAVAAVLGRFSQYSFNSNYGLNGQPLAVGAPTVRSFATEEYDLYGMDIWKIRPNLTVSYGLRWGVNTPVYERSGFEVKPNISLGEFFERRRAAADAGQPLNELITLDRSGKANNRPGFYETDWNNFAPMVSVAWSPDFGDNFFGRLVGREGRSVVRGGFRMVYDRIGSQLAVTFDLNNALGFASSSTVSANTINTSTRPGPLFTGLNQSFRSFPFLTAPGPISFPLSHPADESQRIEQTLDDTLTTPRQYTWNLSYGRELPKGFSFEMGYIGRAGRDLLIVRDVMHLNNLRDTRSNTTWYEAAGLLADLRDRGVRWQDAPRIPYFENLFPGMPANFWGNPAMTPTQAVYRLVAGNGFDIVDWTFVQALIDDESVIGPNIFFHPQYAAFQTLSTIGSADYHGGVLSIRQRFRNEFLFDFNYTLSKSMDNGSPLESTTVLQNVTRNPLDLSLSRSVSDFDVRHNVNANWLLALPFGRNKRFLSDMPTVANALLGGWQLTGIFRYQSGLPVGGAFDVGLWATNWQLTSFGTRTQSVRTANTDFNGRPNLFADPEAAYRSYRNARAGEVGERNSFRIPSYISLDAGLSKSFNMWYAENHRLQFRWEVFNVTNTQRHGVLSSLGLNQDPFLGGASSDFGRYIGSQTPVGESRPGRVMQFALRYTF